MTNSPETLEQQVHQPGAAPAAEPRKRSTPPGRAKPANRRTRAEAEAALLAAWRKWSAANVAADKVSDTDVHAFLRHVKAEEPDLLAFSSKITPYETAFRWIVGDQAGLAPLRPLRSTGRSIGRSPRRPAAFDAPAVAL